ncbi:MAG: polyhydroxyalkanoic acid system family protein [Rhodanobacteraceae bacterium]
MPTIDIRRTHQRALDDARIAIEQVMQSIAIKFGTRHRWEGDRVEFSRGGVQGHIEVGLHSVHVHARLGLLLAGMKPMIEREIQAYFDRAFD